jgi:isoquinoline 1-oxidoreductase subunit alpha
MSVVKLRINGRTESVDVPLDMPLLWVIRDILGLTGTKYSCGIGACKTCAVHLDGVAVPSCMIPIGDVDGRAITTIEGLGGSEPHPVQQAWREEEVSQCGYCQPGQLITAAALLSRNASPTDAEIDEAMGGVLCRCGTYPRIRRAIHRAARLQRR